MPRRPLLILPTPGRPPERRKKHSRPGKFVKPSRARQANRLEEKWRGLQQAFQRLQVDSAGIVPEEVLVLETRGPVSKFLTAVRHTKGMEWLGEVELEDIPPDDDFHLAGDKALQKPLTGRLYLVLANQKTMRDVLSLWKRWKADRPLPHGQTRWRDLFSQLHDVRRWSAKDRLPDSVRDDWLDRIEHDEKTIPCEIELWYRDSKTRRDAAHQRVWELVEEQGGQILDQALIPEIAYHALLAELPAASVEPLLKDVDADIALAHCPGVQFFRATGQAAVGLAGDERVPDAEAVPAPQAPEGLPVVALLDGVPLQSHARLANRLIVDDPDGFEDEYQAGERRHGTAMASLILHGDLNAEMPALTRPIYLRPIFIPHRHPWREGQFEEGPPEVRLLPELVHRAVRRLFEETGGHPAVADSVAVVNLSIGDRDKPFGGAMSPLAKLLDWLAWEHAVLFVVSAGNAGQDLEVNVAPHEFDHLDQEARQAEVLRAVCADTRNRCLLSPAEAINALTVGALHRDCSDGGPPPNHFDPYCTDCLPSPFSRHGMGHRRGIKPDILTSGGRVAMERLLETNPSAKLRMYKLIRPPGQKVAAPGTEPGETAAAVHTRGTSNAAALTSRDAGLLYEVLEELRQDPGGAMLDKVPIALWLKVLLAHSARWGEAHELLRRVLTPTIEERRIREHITRYLGYGPVDASRVVECTPYRVTALGGGQIEAEESHIHRFPLPPSLGGKRGWRELAITLAWFTPTNPLHQGYRGADLWFDPPADQFDDLRLKRREADFHAARRGTLQHEVLEGERAAPFVDGDHVEIHVTCRPDAGKLEDAIPYALAMTLEVAPEMGIEIYEEIRARIHAQVEIAETQ